MATYKTQAKAIGLDFPVLVKFQNGAKNDFAHIFYCVNNEEGLKESLSLEGFDGKVLLIQAYRPHYEQVYKVYCIKDWYNAEIRLSLPEKVIFGSNAYMFDTQIPFDKNDFTEFDPTTDRLNPLTVQFIKAFADFYNLNFYGVDILVEKGTGKHLVIDCNYLPNFLKVPRAELLERLDALLDNEIVLSQQAEVKEEVEKDSEMPMLESQRTLDFSGKQEQEKAQETEAEIDKVKRNFLNCLILGGTEVDVVLDWGRCRGACIGLHYSTDLSSILKKIMTWCVCVCLCVCVRARARVCVCVFLFE